MKKAIVITSIFDPTEAVESFSKMKEYQLIVVGDKKTPVAWSCENTTYLSVEQQDNIGKYLKKVLPYNHYCRKMIGYLHAISTGVDLIVDTDDDNIPKPDWCFPEMNGEFSSVKENQGFVNIYELYTDQHIWPRGLPLNLISKKFDLENKLSRQFCNIGVWQGLADEDPDVDAIYRLTNDTPCNFKRREPIVIGEGTVSPFNTQNTITRKELFATMYLPTYVTFRFTDILRSIIAQPIMWALGYRLGFTNATVIQKRNPHDYTTDFISEIPMYKHCQDAFNTTLDVVNSNRSIHDNMFNVYEALYNKNIVEKKELDVLTAWLKEIK